MKISKKIKFDDIVKHIPKYISLTYVDRNDSFNNHIELLQSSIENLNMEEISDKLHEWYWEEEERNIREIKMKLRISLIIEYSIKKKKAKKLIKKYDERLTDWIYENWDDDTFSSLMRNTKDLIMHYDTGYYMEGESWNWTKGKVRLERLKIKKHLNIPNSNYDYNDAIDMMIAQATYGGQLLIYFNLSDFKEFIDSLQEHNTVTFNNYIFGIIDHFNGSGDICDKIIKVESAFTFNHINFFFEESIKYNWTYSIAGMSDDWADSTKLKFHSEDEVFSEKPQDSPQLLLQKQDKEYNRVFKSGSCSFGDMDITRHGNTSYVNDYPCGNRCPDCNTFWID